MYNYLYYLLLQPNKTIPQIVTQINSLTLKLDYILFIDLTSITTTYIINILIK